METDIDSLNKLAQELIFSIQQSSYLNLKNVTEGTYAALDDFSCAGEGERSESGQLRVSNDDDHEGKSKPITSVDVQYGGTLPPPVSCHDEVKFVVKSEGMSEGKGSQKSDEDYPSTNESDYQSWKNSLSPSSDRGQATYESESIQLGLQDSLDSLDFDNPIAPEEKGKVSQYHGVLLDEKTPKPRSADTPKHSALIYDADGFPNDPTSRQDGTIASGGSIEQIPLTQLKSEVVERPGDTYEVVSERLVISTPRQDREGSSSNEKLEQRQLSKLEESQDVTPLRSHRNKYSNKSTLKGQRDKVNIIARNKKGVGYPKSQGSYAKLHTSKATREPGKVDSVPRSQSSLNDDNDNSEGNDVEGFDMNSEVSPSLLAQSWHAQPLPPIGETSNQVVQSAPADLYKLSYMIQEERRKLIDIGIPFSVLNDTVHGNSLSAQDEYSTSSYVNPNLNVFDYFNAGPKLTQQGSWPQYQLYSDEKDFSRSQIHPSFQHNSQMYLQQDNQWQSNNFTGFPKPFLHNKEAKVVTDKEQKHHTSIVHEGGYQELKKTSLRKQKEYADIVRRQPQKARVSLLQTKTLKSADDIKESKRLIALNYSKSVPKPSKAARKAPKDIRGLQHSVGNNDDVLEIMKKRHEEEKREVERLRKQLSLKLRNGK